MTDLEAYRQRYQRAKHLRAQRNKTAFARRTAAENHARWRKQRARLLLDAAEHGANLSEAAALCGCGGETLRQWLHQHTGSTLWPPMPEAVAKLIDMARK